MPITPSPAVGRGCTLLHRLALRPAEARSVSDLARELAMPRATCDSVLQALAEHGFVARDTDLRYRLGPACIGLGDAARAANTVVGAAAPLAAELARVLEASTAVSVREGGGSRVVEAFDHAPPFGARAEVGQAIPHTPPFGAVYVAWDTADAEAWIERATPALSPTERTRYRAALAAVRQRGYSVTMASPRRADLAAALSALASGTASAPEDRSLTAAARRRRDEAIAELAHGEYLPAELDPVAGLRVSHMSAPVFDRTGTAVASILVVGPDFEITTDELDARARLLVDTAERATAAIGGGRGHEEPT